MELMYMYIEKFNNIIINQEINFSSNFKVSIVDNNLRIKKREDNINGFFGENIKNITTLVGKNGSGKTSVLDILGMNWSDRSRASIRDRKEIKDNYLIVYHISDSYYGIEVLGRDIFKNKITNIDLGNNKDILYKEPMGIIVKGSEENFKYIKRFFEDEKHKITSNIKFNYISNQYSERVELNSFQKENQGHLIARKYYKYKSKSLQYRNIYKIKNIDKEEKDNEKIAKLEILYNLDTDYIFRDVRNTEQIKKWAKDLEEKLYIKSMIVFDDIKKELVKKTFIKKRDFILHFLSVYIMNTFIDGICNMIYDRGYIDLSNVENKFESNENTEEILESLTDDPYMNIEAKEFGELLDEEMEYNNLLKVITYYYAKKDISEKDKLIYISRYLHLRIESHISLGSENYYNNAIEEFINSIESWDIGEFRTDGILMDCTKDINENIRSTLDIYDKYVNEDTNRYNDLGSKVSINFRCLSEGEKSYLNLFTKIADILSQASKEKLTIILLDEPDASLHPEWSRRLIHNVCKLIDNNGTKYVQIVLSTHSPFILSDIPSSNAVFLENKEYRTIIKTKDVKTFGANIHELLIKDFFMDSTIGEFAKSKMEETVKKMLRKIEGSENKVNEEDKYEDYNDKEIKFIIESIGDSIISQKMKELYLKAHEDNYLMEKKKQLEKELKEIEEKLQEQDGKECIEN